MMLNTEQRLCFTYNVHFSFGYGVPGRIAVLKTVPLYYHSLEFLRFLSSSNWAHDFGLDGCDPLLACDKSCKHSCSLNRNLAL